MLKKLLAVALLLFASPLFLKALLTPKFISKRQAINKVKDLPEVKEFFRIPIKVTANQKSEAYIDAEERDKEYWLVHVASIETYPAEASIPGRLATMNWYKLSKKTGRIECSMVLYDSKGKSIGSGETEKRCF